MAVNTLPILGAGLGWLTLLLLPLLLWPGAPSYGALLIWLIGATALGVLAWGIGTGIEVPGAERREDLNLVASRGAVVRRWIVAHVDTKAQGHSMAGRLVSVWLLIAAVLGLTLLAVGRATLGVALPTVPVAAGAGLALAAGALAGRGRLRGTSAGARDNGTGLLAAVVAAAAEVDPLVGFLFTGAEEFGLVGARAFAQAAGGMVEAEAINLDTLDDRGRLYLVSHDSAGDHFAAQLEPALGRLGPPITRRRLPLGILTDSLPLARAGSRAVTLSRMDWNTLRRMHTPRDDAAGLDLTLAEEVGRAVALLPRPVDPLREGV